MKQDCRAVAAGALIGLSTLWVMPCRASGSDAAATPLKPRNLAPFVVSLPDWEAKSSSDLGATGRIRLASPANENQMVQITWGPGEMIDASAMTSMVDKIGFEPLRSVPLHASLQGNASLRGDALRFASKRDDQRLLIADVYCKSSDSHLNVWVSLPSSWDDDQRMAERILGSVRCLGPVRSALTLPRFVPRNGYRQTARIGDGVGYVNPSGARIMFIYGQPPMPFQSQAGPEAAIFTMAFKQMDLQHVAFEDHVRRMGGKDVMFGEADNARGEHVHLMGIMWNCEEPRQSFSGFYVGKADPAATHDDALLASAQCP